MAPVGKSSTWRTSGPRNLAASARKPASSSPVDSNRCVGAPAEMRSSPCETSMRYTSAAVSSALDTSRTCGPMTYWIAADISG